MVTCDLADLLELIIYQPFSFKIKTKNERFILVEPEGACFSLSGPAGPADLVLDASAFSYEQVTYMLKSEWFKQG